MSVEIKNNVIKLTRGDTLRTCVSITLPNGEDYVPVDGDVITFGLSTDIKEDPFLTIDIPYDTCELHITPEQTKDLEYGIYYYDIQITLTNGDVYTFVTYNKFVVLGEVVR